MILSFVSSTPALVIATDHDFTVTNNTLQIDPFIITETTYLGESSISADECQQKIQLMDDSRCQPPNTGNGYKPDPEAIQRCKLRKPQGGLSCKCRVQVTYPQFASNEYNKAALDKINLELKVRAEKFKNKYATALADCMPSTITNEYSLTYNLEFKGKYGGAYQLYQNGKVLTVQYSSSIASEAQPVYTNNFFNFDLSLGTLLTFKDIIKKKSLGSVYDNIWVSLTKDTASYFFDNKATNYEQATASLKPPFKIENFYFGERELIVYFNPYDVGPLSSGDFVFQVMRENINKQFL